MCLQSNKTRLGIDTRRVPPYRIGRTAPEPSCFLVIKANNVILVVYLDFVPVPALRCEVLIALVILLPRPCAKGFYFVNGSGPGEERTVRLAETRITTCFFVNLDFKSGMHRDKSGVVRRVDRVGCRIGQPRVAE